MTFWKCYHHMGGGNILITLVCFENILITISLFWEHHDHIQKTEQHLKQISNVPIGHVVETFSECHWGNFKWLLTVIGDQMWCTCWCYIPNVAPIGSRSNTWSGNIWNVPNLLLAGKWWVPSTRAYNVLKMFLLVSRPPRPQWGGYGNHDKEQFNGIGTDVGLWIYRWVCWVRSQ